MNLKRPPTIIILATACVSLHFLAAQENLSFSEAKLQSARTGRPILMEFVREGCEYCEKAERESKSNPDIIETLKKVIHPTINVALSDGYELSKKYRVGYTYPVFILTDKDGNPINRWTGYFGARHFIGTLDKALNDLTIISDREKRAETEPNSDDIQLLAKYYEQATEYLEAVKYYQKLDRLQPKPRIDIKYSIFTNYANACWNGMIPPDKVLLAADDVLAMGSNNHTARTARTLTNLAARVNLEGRIEKYINAGLSAISSDKSEKSQDDYQLLLADKALYVDLDTAQAIGIIKNSLGDDWQSTPDKYYRLARICQKRNINLEEAEKYARQAASLASGGIFRAGIFNTLAEICAARENFVEAVKAAEKAIEEDPASGFYQEQLEKFREKLRK